MITLFTFKSWNVFYFLQRILFWMKFWFLSLISMLMLTNDHSSRIISQIVFHFCHWFWIWLTLWFWCFFLYFLMITLVTFKSQMVFRFWKRILLMMFWFLDFFRYLIMNIFVLRSHFLSKKNPKITKVSPFRFVNEYEDSCVF